MKKTRKPPLEALPGRVVYCHYVAKLHSPTGRLIEQTDDGPHVFVMGADSNVPGFENLISGARAGEQRSGVVRFPVRDTQLDVIRPREDFKPDGDPDAPLPNKTYLLKGHDKEKPTFWRVVYVDDIEVVLSMSPDYSGDELYYQIEVIRVRPASSTELLTGIPEDLRELIKLD